MRKLVAGVFAALVLGLVLPHALGDDEKIKEIKDSEWYPLKLGNEWTYTVQGQKIHMKVAEYEKVGDTVCARLETENAQGVVSATEDVAVKDDGVYRYKMNGSKIDPPLCFFKLPPKLGAKWKVKSKQGKVTTKGDFEEDEEKIEVPSGQYKAITAKGAFEITSPGADDDDGTTQSMTVTYYFAKGMGMVKQTVEFQGKIVIDLELKKFKAASKDDADKDKTDKDKKDADKDKKDPPKDDSKKDPPKDDPKPDKGKDF